MAGLVGLRKFPDSIDYIAWNDHVDYLGGPSSNPLLDTSLLKQRMRVLVKSSDYTMDELDMVILATGGASGITITLPAASSKVGMYVHIKKIDSGTGAVTIATQGSDTIQGATSVLLGSQYASRTLVSDGVSTWYVLAST